MVSGSRSTAVAARLVLTLIAICLGAAEAHGAQLTASWIDNSNGTAATRLERRPVDVTAFTAIADVPAGVTEYVDASVNAGTTYCYRVLAHDTTGVSPYSDEACASPPPPTPLTLVFTNPASGATVSGTATVSLSANGGSGYTFTVKADGTTIYSGTNGSFSWNTTVVANGSHTLTGSVTMNSQSATATLPVTVSNVGSTPLTVAFTVPTAGATVTGMTAIGMTSSGASGASTFRLAVDGTALSTQTVPGASATYVWNTTTATPGPRTLTLTVTDAAARTATATLPVTVTSSGSPSTGPCSAPDQPVLDVPGTYSTIQAAINAAADGSCIVVAPGTYRVNLQIVGRYVELRAASSDPTQTILDGGQFGSVVVFQNVPYNPAVPFIQTARIAGFTIQNGRSIEGQGGGITLANQAEVFVTNNIIRNNTSAMDGGGVLIYNRSHATLSSNAITGNTAPRFGGGLYVVGDGSAGGGSHPVIYNNVITNNAATGFAIPNGGAAGGGILVAGHSAPTIVGNVVSGNTAPFAGGGLCLLSGDNGFVVDNTITGNAAAYGGGIHIGTNGTGVVVSENTISNNTATFNAGFPGSGFGGGVSVYAQSQPTIVRNTITGNTATYGGGGIAVAEDANASIRANTISGNVVNGNPTGSPIGPPPGGGIYVSHALATIVNNLIDGNSAGYGGGIGLLGGVPTVVTIENNTIVKNVATVTPQSATGRGGGGLFVPVDPNCTPATTTIVRNNIFDLNTGLQIFEACRGGATYTNNLVNAFSDGMYFNYQSGAVTTIATFNATVAGGGNISGSPGFVNAASNDFRLTSASAAIDQGTPTGAPLDDVANADRPAGTGYDIGAYEFTGQTVVKSPVYRLFSLTNAVHFYTQSKSERDVALATYPYRLWRFEGTAYQTYPSPLAGTVAMHRFFSFTRRSHFYTTNLCEMYTDCQIHSPGDTHAVYSDNVWHYEGIAFDVYPAAVAGATPVYRFFSPVLSHHFYTNSEAEKNGLLADPTTAHWHFEGIAWYVPGS